ncbi:MAG TPA: cation diffusion facilitator family transporter [Chthoniobacteraceae bacterium]|nr:cation diffusion facilitator family transporter [Chthoniobacteraceae bacterium]
MSELRCGAVSENTTIQSTKRRLRTGQELAVIGVAVNAALAGIKIATGIVGNTYALIADGFESTLDIFSSIIIWYGLKVAAEPPDDEHPYGHGKAEPVATIVVSLVLIAAALGLAVQSVREILTPHHTPAPFTLVVLLVVVIVKEVLFRKMHAAGTTIESGAVKSDAWHHRSDAITSGAAFIGISIALMGGPGWESADDWAALLACGFIGWNGWNLLRPAMREAMDTAPPGDMVSNVRAVAASVRGVNALDQCLIRKSGLEFFVDIHVGVNPDLTVREGHRIAHEVRNAVRASNPAIAEVLVHIEPDDELDD